MNNNTLLSENFVQSTYDNIIFTQLVLASTVIFTYGSILHLPDEVDYIWKTKFGLPTFFYLFSKYSFLVYQIIYTVQNFIPPTDLSPSVCTSLLTAVQILPIFTFIGVQGLISLRTYAICQYRPVAIALSVGFFFSLGCQIYRLAVLLADSTFAAVCSSSLTSSTVLIVSKIVLLIDGAVIFSDIIQAIGGISQVWGLWRLKRSLSLQSNKSLVSELIRQDVLGFFLVFFVSTIPLILVAIPHNQITENNVGIYIEVFQNILVVLSICNFMLSIRRRNMGGLISNPSALELSTLAFQVESAQSARSVLGRLHENITTEMGERNDSLVD